MSRTHATPARLKAETAGGNLFEGYATASFATALLLGGATGKWVLSDGAVLVMAGPLLVWAVLRLRHIDLGGPARTGLALLAATALLQALHLLPLPPALWTALPGRADLVAALASAGLEAGWAPLSIAPWATLFGLATLAVPAGLFAAALSLPARTLRIMVWLMLAVAAFNVLLGAAQVAGGQSSPLRFFEFTNFFQPVGVFANANHLACSLAISIPFAASIAADETRGSSMRFMAAGAAVLLLVGVASTLSRAGVLLAVIACGAAGLALLQARNVHRHYSLLLLAGLALAAAAIVAQLGAVGIARRSEALTPLNSRVVMAEGGAAAAAAFAPAGSGFGTTRTAYAMMETPDDLLVTVVNQVHNDYLQLWLEGGVAGVGLGLAFLVWAGWAAVRRARGRDFLGSIAPAACLVIIALHSLVDYPLRTLAIQACLALSLALLVRSKINEHRDCPRPK